MRKRMRFMIKFLREIRNGQEPRLTVRMGRWIFSSYDRAMNRCHLRIAAPLVGVMLAAGGCAEVSAPIRRAPAKVTRAKTPARSLGPSVSPSLPKPVRPGRWVASPPPLPERSRRELRALLRAAPKGSQSDGILYDLAVQDFTQRRFDTSIGYLKNLHKRFPLSSRYEDSEYLLGLALQASGRYQAAFLPLRGSLSREKNPLRRGLLHAALGEVYEARKDPYAAVLSYAQALKHHPALPKANLLRARVLSLAKTGLASHQIQAAAKRFRKGPAGPILRLEFARRAAAENRPETALAAARIFLKDYPGHRDRPEAAKLEKNLREILAVKQGRVGVLLPLSGTAAAAGERVYQGIQLALRHTLERNPELRLQLAVRDTRSTPQTAGKAAEKAAELIDKEKVIALIGPFFTAATEAAAAVAHKKGTPLLTPFAIHLNMETSSPMVFRNSLTNRLQSIGIAVYAVQILGLRRFAVLFPENRDGRELAEQFSDNVRRLGGRVVKMVSFPPETNDFGAQMRALGGLSDAQVRRRKRALGLGKNAPYHFNLEFEALFVPAYHEKAVLIAPQVPFYNMRGIRLLGGRGWNNRDLIRYGEKYVDQAIFVDGFFSDSTEPRVVRFVNEFNRLFGRKPDIFSALGYDAAMIIFSGLTQGGTTRNAMRSYLGRLKSFEGIMGLTDMGPDGDTKRQLFVLTVKKRRIEHLQMVTPHRIVNPVDGAPLIVDKDPLQSAPRRP